MTDTDEAWRWWGEHDPYFAVLSYDKFRKDRIGESKNEFMQSGESHVAALLREIEERYGAVERNVALEFGCGVGRLLVPLARRFRHVVGIDISEAMLAEAEKNCAAEGLANVSFLMSDDHFGGVPDHVDLIHSSLV